MRLSSSLYFGALASLFVACLGPNPLLEECGERWFIEIWAVREDPGSTGLRPVCENLDGGYCIRPRGYMCLNRDQAKDLVENPGGPVEQALEAKAVGQCHERAVSAGSSWNSCDDEDSLRDPEYDGRCMLEADQCTQPYGGQTSEETGDETGAGGLYLDGVEWDSEGILVPEFVIEAVLTADEATLLDDGTTFAPHYHDGRQDGWVVDGVTPHNIGGVLGFEDGDVITQVGPVSVDSWDAVVTAANNALSAERIEVAFERQGRVQAITYVRTDP